ncbi:hypothetical protein, partial [Asaia sp. As-1742]|uniref:hypothetical protein n=1 Tax=Asaia sp. As-1742 TaxID=2608325 RepID=UPI001965132A
MPNESIAIVYKPITSPLGDVAYHETLIYTRADGSMEYAFATPSSPASDSAAMKALDLVDTEAAVAVGASSPLGTLVKQSGSIDASNTSEILGSSNAPWHQEEVASGSDLSSQWNTIESTFSNIQSANIQYGALTQNSNSSAATALDAAGISEPQDAGWFEKYFTPGIGNIFSLPGVNGSDDEKIDSNDSGLIKIDYMNGRGDVKGSLIIQNDGSSDSVIKTINSDGSTADSTKYSYDASGNITNQAITDSSGNNVDISEPNGVSSSDPLGYTDQNGNIESSAINVIVNIGNDINFFAEGSGQNITDGNGGTITLSGANGDTLNPGSNVTLNVNPFSDNNTFNMEGTGDVVNVGGSSENFTGSIWGASKETFNFGDNVGNDTLNGNDDTVTMGSDTATSLTGTGDTVTSGDGGSLNLSNADND